MKCFTSPDLALSFNKHLEKQDIRHGFFKGHLPAQSSLMIV